jgi:hypothetical protein
VVGTFWREYEENTALIREEAMKKLYALLDYGWNPHGRHLDPRSPPTKAG